VPTKAERADPDRLLAKVDERTSRVSVAEVIAEALAAEDVEAARALHRNLLASRPDSVRLGERLLISSGTGS
jgi:hypothetical protein